MTKMKKDCFSLVCLILGALLLLGCVGYFVYNGISSKISTSDNRQILERAEKLIPERTQAFPEERGNNTMASLEVLGTNVVGILEMPSHDAKFPLRSGWDSGEAEKMPCRYTGSIYDRTLVIGATDRSGQMDFIASVSGEEKLYLTDMEGCRYTYTVTSIKHSDVFNAEKWQNENADLCIFVRSTFSGEYTILYCTAK